MTTTLVWIAATLGLLVLEIENMRLIALSGGLPMVAAAVRLLP